MQFGQRAMLRYTEFTSNECLPAGRAEIRGNLRDEDMDHSVAGCSPVARLARLTPFGQRSPPRCSEP